MTEVSGIIQPSVLSAIVLGKKCTSYGTVIGRYILGLKVGPFLLQLGVVLVDFE